MLTLIASFLMSTRAHAVLTEPTYHAAEALGYLVVGEIEFKKDAFEPKKSQVEEQTLAMKRAGNVAEILRTRIQGPLSFDLINMANRKPHPIQVANSSRVREETNDAKAAMENAGAAPSNAYGMGLFGEHGQRSKVVIWIDCKESFGRRRSNVLANVQLASRGADSQVQPGQD